MLRVSTFVTPAVSFRTRNIRYMLCPWRKPLRQYFIIVAAPDMLNYQVKDQLALQSGVVQDFRGNAAILMRKAEQDMLASDQAVPQLDRRLLRMFKCFYRPFREPRIFLSKSHIPHPFHGVLNYCSIAKFAGDRGGRPYNGLPGHF
jgi:hypothetical protein